MLEPPTASGYTHQPLAEDIGTYHFSYQDLEDSPRSRYKLMWGDDGREENQEMYRAGGLHPIHINELYSSCPNAPDRGRYRILQKLGHGVFSTVWFVQDLSLPNSNSRGFALKFVVSSTTTVSREAAVSQYLASRPKDHPGFRNFALCYDFFQHLGPNGVHDVLVTDPLISVSDLCSTYLMNAMDEQDIIRQVLTGLSFIHDQGVVHRDLHCGNIAVDFSFLHTAGVEELMEELDAPLCRPSITSAPGPHPPSLPHYIVEKWGAGERLFHLIVQHAASMVVKIIDFGCAFRPGIDEHPTLNRDGPLGAPQCLRAPETTIAIVYEKHPYINNQIPVPSTPAWSAKSDIWTLGCSLSEIYSRLPGSFAFFSGEPDAFHLHDVARFLGPLPPLYLDILRAISPSQYPCGAEKREQDVETNWSVIVPRIIRQRHDPEHLRGNRSWGDTIRKPRISPEDDLIRVKALFSLVRQMLRWDPEDRISIKDALETEFFRTRLHVPLGPINFLQESLAAMGTKEPAGFVTSFKGSF